MRERIIEELEQLARDKWIKIPILVQKVLDLREPGTEEQLPELNDLVEDKTVVRDGNGVRLNSAWIRRAQ